MTTERTVEARPRGASKVLVVDDSAETQTRHARHLAGAGLAVHMPGDHGHVLDEIRQIVPDVVVLDVDDPLVDGLDVCRQLREDTTTRHVSLVGMTRDATQQGMAAFRSGCDVVLGKPCSEHLLLAAVQLLLDRPRTAARSVSMLRTASA